MVASLQDWSTEGYQLFMLRQQKIYSDETSSENNVNSGATTATATNTTTDGETEPKSQLPSQKPTLTHTYSNLSDKSYIPPEPPHRFRTTLIQLDFVKSSFTVNPCMVRSARGKSNAYKVLN